MDKNKNWQEISNRIPIKKSRNESIRPCLITIAYILYPDICLFSQQAVLNHQNYIL